MVGVKPMKESLGDVRLSNYGLKGNLEPVSIECILTRLFCSTMNENFSMLL